MVDNNLVFVYLPHKRQAFCTATNLAAKNYPTRLSQKLYTVLGRWVWNVYQDLLLPLDDCLSSRAVATLLTRFDKKRRTRWSEAAQNIVFFYTSAERHGASLTTSLAGHDTPPSIIAAFQLTPFQHSYSKSGNTKVLSANHIDSYQKKCQTVGGHQQQHQSMLLVILRQQSLQPLSKIQSRVKLRDLTLYVRGWSPLLELP